MSGHSKWSTIKRQKGAADQKRGTLFTKLGNAVTVAAKEGGGDPDTNFKLRLAIDKAKSANMPNDNIDRAIKRGTGELAGEKLQEMIFEGYGPGGVALIMEAYSGNRNRTTSHLRHLLDQQGGKLAENGSVSWNFERKGVVIISAQNNKEEVELKAIDAGADDLKEEEQELIVYTKPDQLEKVKNQLEKAGIKIDYSEIEMVAKNQVKISKGDRAKLNKLLEELEGSEEVNNYYTNAQS